MLTFRLHMEFSQETHDEAASVLRSLVGPVRSEPGCNATRLLKRTANDHGLTWVEEWRSVSLPSPGRPWVGIDLAKGPEDSVAYVVMGHKW